MVEMKNGLNLSGKPNRIDRKGFQWGAWNRGYVYSSPLWLGLRSGNAISRVGYSHSRVQDATQNFVHRYIGRQHYYNNYRLFNKFLCYDSENFIGREKRIPNNIYKMISPSFFKMTNKIKND